MAGTSLYLGPEDQKESTVGNAVYTGWKATLDLTGDLDAIADAYIAQVTNNGYTLLPEDKGENTSDGPSAAGPLPESRKSPTPRRSERSGTDQVVINVLKSDSGTGEVTINVEHIRYSD